MPYSKLLLTIVCVITASTGLGDDFDEFESFDFDFEFKPKSTIDTFPLQGIDTQEMSNAAIKGALQTSIEFSGRELNKPAHQKVDEDSEYRQKSEVHDKEFNAQRSANYEQDPLSEPTPEIHETYVFDNGRTLDISTTTVERP